MTEAFSDHKIQCIRSTCIRSCTKRVLGHNFRDGYVAGLDTGSNHPKCQILSSEDTGNSIIIVCDKNAVFSLCCHQLCCLSHCRVRFDLEGLTGSEGEDGSRRGFSCLSCTTGGVLLLAEIGLNFPSNGLQKSALSADKELYWHTSSLLVCFCLLALIVEPPASLWAAEVP